MKPIEKISLVITCGGTGGHFYPGLSIARHVQGGGGRALLILSGTNAAAQCATAKRYGIDAVELPRMPSPRRAVNFLPFATGLAGGIRMTRAVLKEFRPDAMLGMGSFASLPALTAAKTMKIPIFLHDGNARIGRANRFLSRFASGLATAFPAVNAAQIHCTCTCVGMPLRPELLTSGRRDKAEAIAALNAGYGANLTVDLPMVLIFGGSQGAATLNGQIPQALLGFAGTRFQVLHLTGVGKDAEVRELYQAANFPVLVLPTATDMENFYGAADLIFSRSGGSSVAELTFFGKAAVLIPYPYAAEQHQQDNAAFLTSHDAAHKLNDADCTVVAATSLLQSFLGDEAAWRQRGINAAALARPDAADRLLELIFP